MCTSLGKRQGIISPSKTRQQTKIVYLCQETEAFDTHSSDSSSSPSGLVVDDNIS